MKEICFEITSNEEVWSLIDKRLNNIFIHKFMPHEAISWWKTNLQMPNQEIFEGLKVRNMVFDLHTDLESLNKLLKINTYHLSIYQFHKPVPDTLVMDHLPEHNKQKILIQNGLQHCFSLNFEFLTIASFDADFISAIENDEQFKGRILTQK